MQANTEAQGSQGQLAEDALFEVPESKRFRPTNSTSSAEPRPCLPLVPQPEVTVPEQYTLQPQAHTEATSTAETPPGTNSGPTATDSPLSRKIRFKSSNLPVAHDICPPQSCTERINHRRTVRLGTQRSSEDQVFEAFYRFYKVLGDVDQVCGRNLKHRFLEFILCGEQSVGKSLIVERLVGFPLNIVGHNQGTRLPLRVELLHDDNVPEYACTLTILRFYALTGIKRKDYHNIKFTEIQAAITKLNLEAPQVTDKPIVLTVRSKKVRNLAFIDLPGLFSVGTTGQGSRDAIKALVANYAKRDNVIPVVVMEPRDYATQGVIAFLDDKVPTWKKKSIVVMNKMDKAETSYTSAAMLQSDLLQQYFDCGVQVFLLALKNAERRNLTFEDLNEILVGANQCEADFFQKYYDGLEGKLDRDRLEKITGLGKLEVHLRQIMWDNVMNELPFLEDTIRQEKADITADVIDLHLSTLLPDQNISLQMRYLSAKDKDLTCRLMEMVYKISLKIIDYLNGTCAVQERRISQGKTLVDELTEYIDHGEFSKKWLNEFSAEEKSWQEFLISNFLGTGVTGEGTPVAAGDNSAPPRQVTDSAHGLQIQYADLHLVGGKQFQRLKDFLGVALIQFSSVNNEALVSSIGHLLDTTTSEDWEHAVSDIVKYCVGVSLHPAMNWFCRVNGDILYSLLDIALIDLSNYGAGAKLFKDLKDVFKSGLRVYYKEFISSLVTKASDSVQTATTPMYTFVQHNLTRRLSKIIFPSTTDSRELLSKTTTSSSSLEEEGEPAPTLSSTKTDSGELFKGGCLDLRMGKGTEIPFDRTAKVNTEAVERISNASSKYIFSLIMLLLPHAEAHFNEYMFLSFKRDLPLKLMLYAVQSDPWLALYNMTSKEAKDEYDALVVQEKSYDELLTRIDALKHAL
ncbi:hypothetical protein Pelo_5954 [Pelomyxa schiedti]|nr:hypothetical protein Pelo_5954 [Pelomyxa schiedti]